MTKEQNKYFLLLLKIIKNEQDEQINNERANLAFALFDLSFFIRFFLFEMENIDKSAKLKVKTNSERAKHG